MKKLTREEQLNIIGGINITGVLIGHLVRGASIVLDLGRSVGTAIRRITSNKLCSIY